MTVLATEPTPIQERILRNNFDRVGPFFVGRDLHPMLDCACAPELSLVAPPDTSGLLDLDIPLTIPFPAKLREEFFGGIAFDRTAHAHYMLDRDSFAMLSSVSILPRTGRDLLDEATRTSVRQDTVEILKALYERRLLGQHTGQPVDALQFPARDLSLGYLQSPIIVEIEVTYGCFRACRHCAYESSPDARTPDELTSEQWALVFDKLAASGVLIVQLTGGDPLFRPDSYDIVEAADAAGMSVYVRSDTAALNRRSIERLRALDGLWHVGTSIDGAEAAMHDWMRGRGAFDLLRERVGALADAGIDVAAGATLHKNNFRTVRDIGRRASEFGARWFDIGFLSPVGRGSAMHDLVLEPAEIAACLDSYLDGLRAGDYEPSHAHYARRAAAGEPFLDLVGLADKLPYVTEWPFSRLRLDPRGSAYTAGKLKGSDFASGFDLVNAELPYVWDNSPNLVQLRELGRGGRIHSLDYRLLRSSHELM